MALIGRMFVVLAGFIAASFAASLVVVLAALYPQWSDLQLGPMEGDWIGVAATIGFVFVSGFALMPALAVIALAETFSIRALTFYAAAGALTGVAVIAGLGGFDPAALAIDSFSRRELEIMIGAGIIGGAVYWLIAGRRSGAWREKPATPPPLPPAAS
ncbi:MAG: hypothetical protein EPO23_14450 [Xanthobacteraceae bacterium]|nr:MAG: hypothetical protein EPO23_14450 [Xanthobacteraceae bacterium]